MQHRIFAWVTVGLLVGHQSTPAAARDAVPIASNARGMPGTLARADEQAIRKVVQGQLDAFAADDAEAAFAFASPAIQKQFGTAMHFMDVVRNGYPAVVRPARVVFLKPERFDMGVSGGAGAAVVQGVQLTDADGRSWLATYSIERMADKSWRIAGCVVTENRSLGT